MQSLLGIRRFDEAVDVVVEVQRQLRDLSAWIVMAKAMANDRDWSSSSRGKRPVPPANDEYIGVWVNGGEEDDVLWLLDHSMPCFIIHEVTHEEQERHIYAPSRRFPWLKEFAAETDAKLLLPRDNGYDDIASRPPCMPHTARVIPAVIASLPPPNPNLQKLSSAWEQGWMGRVIGSDSIDIPPDWSQWELPSDYDAPPLDRVSLNPSHVEWIRPPPVASTKGSWDVWVQDLTDDDDRIPCIRKARKKEDVDDVSHPFGPYFDRKKCRELYFDEPVPIPPGYISAQKLFGLPAPRMLYLHEVGHKITRAVASRWMYLSREHG
ncbi:hypothetical protein Hypma_013489 [Hypsizygus marmoreus]|uniref:Uncharacterized protein n=1 Tax=Hypsizygus marmoreus TaxID=39966 RepID=A0A369JG60_HYPMA|nr:hypothetical protein Hypma_013489 [Hypsizygus marmoreus]